MNGLCISVRSKLYGPHNTQSDSFGMPSSERFLSSPNAFCTSSDRDALERPPVLEPRTLMPTWLATANGLVTLARPSAGSITAMDAI